MSKLSKVLKEEESEEDCLSEDEKQIKEFKGKIKEIKNNKKLKQLDDIIDDQDKHEFKDLFNGEIGLSRVYADNNLSRIKIIDDKTGYYLNINCLWVKQTKDFSFFIYDVCDFLEKYILACIDKYKQDPAHNKKTLKKLREILSNCRKKQTGHHIFELARPRLHDKDFFSKLNSNKQILSFKDGVFDLKECKFRPRSKEDYLTFTLQFNYKKVEPTDKIYIYINSIIKRISNDNDKLFEFVKSYLGYCLTGETHEQKFLIVCGIKASNGKSTIAKMFEMALEEYTVKLSNETFKKNYPKYHKQIARLKDESKRFVYIEELDRTHLDIERIKDFADGHKLNNEVMYGTSEDICLQSKLWMNTNKVTSFDPDGGLERRGLQINCNNRFVNEKTYNDTKNKKNLYIKDKTLLDKFKNNEHKLAFINVLIPYAKQYYEKGLIIPQEIEDSFSELCKENDLMANFIEDYYEITDKKSDRVYKNEFLDLYNEIHKTHHTWAYLLSDVKRKLTYDKDSKKLNSSLRGCIIGIVKKIDGDGENNNIIENDSAKDNEV